MGAKIIRINEPPPPKPEKVSISDLINKCNAAADTMGNGNPHKLLIMNCAFAMRQLVDRLSDVEFAYEKLKVEWEATVEMNKVVTP